MTLHKKYVLDENNRPVAVQLPVDEFNKLETVLEDYGLYKLIEETENEDSLPIGDAKKYYDTLNKNVED
jgi:PHD/YefM family antitoxin component YafN of YafNO toxin-antitoxin module